MREGTSAGQQRRGSIQVIVLPQPTTTATTTALCCSGGAALKKVTMMWLKGQPEWTGEVGGGVFTRSHPPQQRFDLVYSLFQLKPLDTRKQQEEKKKHCLTGKGSGRIKAYYYPPTLQF